MDQRDWEIVPIWKDQTRSPTSSENKIVILKEKKKSRATKPEGRRRIEMFLRVGGAVRIWAERKGIRLQIKSRRMRWNRAIQMAIRLNLLILPWLKANTRRCSGDIGGSGKVDVDDDVDENCAAAAAGRELSSPTPTHPDDGIGPPYTVVSHSESALIPPAKLSALNFIDGA